MKRYRIYWIECPLGADFCEGLNTHCKAVSNQKGMLIGPNRKGSTYTFDCSNLCESHEYSPINDNLLLKLAGKEKNEAIRKFFIFLLKMEESKRTKFILTELKIKKFL